MEVLQKTKYTKHTTENKMTARNSFPYTKIGSVQIPSLTSVLLSDLHNLHSTNLLTYLPFYQLILVTAREQSNKNQSEESTQRNQIESKQQGSSVCREWKEDLWKKENEKESNEAIMQGMRTVGREESSTNGCCLLVASLDRIVNVLVRERARVAEEIRLEEKAAEEECRNALAVKQLVEVENTVFREVRVNWESESNSSLIENCSEANALGNENNEELVGLSRSEDGSLIGLWTQYRVGVIHVSQLAKKKLTPMWTQRVNLGGLLKFHPREPKWGFLNEGKLVITNFSCVTSANESVYSVSAQNIACQATEFCWLANGNVAVGVKNGFVKIFDQNLIEIREVPPFTDLNDSSYVVKSMYASEHVLLVGYVSPDSSNNPFLSSIDLRDNLFHHYAVDVNFFASNFDIPNKNLYFCEFIDSWKSVFIAQSSSNELAVAVEDKNANLILSEADYDLGPCSFMDASTFEPSLIMGLCFAYEPSLANQLVQSNYESCFMFLLDHTGTIHIVLWSNLEKPFVTYPNSVKQLPVDVSVRVELDKQEFIASSPKTLSLEKCETQAVPFSLLPIKIAPKSHFPSAVSGSAGVSTGLFSSLLPSVSSSLPSESSASKLESTFSATASLSTKELQPGSISLSSHVMPILEIKKSLGSESTSASSLFTGTFSTSSSFASFNFNDTANALLSSTAKFGAGTVKSSAAENFQPSSESTSTQASLIATDSPQHKRSKALNPETKEVVKVLASSNQFNSVLKCHDNFPGANISESDNKLELVETSLVAISSKQASMEKKRWSRLADSTQSSTVESNRKTVPISTPIKDASCSVTFSALKESSYGHSNASKSDFLADITASIKADLSTNEHLLSEIEKLLNSSNFCLGGLDFRESQLKIEKIDKQCPNVSEISKRISVLHIQASDLLASAEEKLELSKSPLQEIPLDPHVKLMRDRNEKRHNQLLKSIVEVENASEPAQHVGKTNALSCILKTAQNLHVASRYSNDKIRLIEAQCLNLMKSKPELFKPQPRVLENFSDVSTSPQVVKPPYKYLSSARAQRISEKELVLSVSKKLASSINISEKSTLLVSENPNVPVSATPSVPLFDSSKRPLTALEYRLAQIKAKTPEPPSKIEEKTNIEAAKEWKDSSLKFGCKQLGLAQSLIEVSPAIPNRKLDFSYKESPIGEQLKKDAPSIIPFIAQSEKANTPSLLSKVSVVKPVLDLSTKSIDVPPSKLVLTTSKLNDVEKVHPAGPLDVSFPHKGADKPSLVFPPTTKPTGEKAVIASVSNPNAAQDSVVSSKQVLATNQLRNSDSKSSFAISSSTSVPDSKKNVILPSVLPIVKLPTEANDASSNSESTENAEKLVSSQVAIANKVENKELQKLDNAPDLKPATGQSSALFDPAVKSLTAQGNLKIDGDVLLTAIVPPVSAAPTSASVVAPKTLIATKQDQKPLGVVEIATSTNFGMGSSAAPIFSTMAQKPVQSNTLSVIPSLAQKPVPSSAPLTILPSFSNPQGATIAPSTASSKPVFGDLGSLSLGGATGSKNPFALQAGVANRANPFAAAASTGPSAVGVFGNAAASTGPSAVGVFGNAAASTGPSAVGVFGNAAPVVASTASWGSVNFSQNSQSAKPNFGQTGSTANIFGASQQTASTNIFGNTQQPVQSNFFTNPQPASSPFFSNSSSVQSNLFANATSSFAIGAPINSNPTNNPFGNTGANQFGSGNVFANSQQQIPQNSFSSPQVTSGFPSKPTFGQPSTLGGNLNLASATGAVFGQSSGFGQMNQPMNTFNQGGTNAVFGQNSAVGNVFGQRVGAAAASFTAGLAQFGQPR